jgi:hypothetical protein
MPVMWILIRICMEPNHFGKLDPDPHQSERKEPDPDPHQREKVESLEGYF